MPVLPPVPGPSIDPIAVFAGTVETINAHNEWHDSLHRKANYFHDVKDYGAAGDGVVDDSGAIQSASDAASNDGGTVIFPPGTYRTESTIVFLNCNVDIIGSAVLEVASNVGVGVQVGSSAVSCDHRTLNLPRVEAEGSGWYPNNRDDTTRGVVFRAADGCLVTVNDVAWFNQGLVLEGDGQGVAYNTFHISRLSTNRTNLYMNRISGGWSNQNTFIGGRWGVWDHESVWDETNNLPGVRQVWIDGPENNNTFLNCSLEGRAELMIDCNGSSNTWLTCRFESADSVGSVRFGPTARRNVVQGGSYVDRLVILDEADSDNAVLQPSQWGWVTVEDAK